MSIIRTRKFISRGWHIHAGQYLKMCWQVAELDLKRIDVLMDQLMGVDVAYFHELIERLSEDKKVEDRDGVVKDIDFTYIAELVDKLT